MAPTSLAVHRALYRTILRWTFIKEVRSARFTLPLLAPETEELLRKLTQKLPAVNTEVCGFYELNRVKETMFIYIYRI